MINKESTAVQANVSLDVLKFITFSSSHWVPYNGNIFKCRSNQGTVQQ